MSLIDLAKARAHVRVPPTYPDSQITPYLNGAVKAATQFLNRNVYATAEDLATATAAAPAAMAAAAAAYTSAVAAANAVADEAVRNELRSAASIVYREALDAARMALLGIVLEDDIETGILLLFGHLFENREENVTGTIVAELKIGTKRLLWPYRVDVGV